MKKVAKILFFTMDKENNNSPLLQHKIQDEVVERFVTNHVNACFVKSVNFVA